MKKILAMMAAVCALGAYADGWDGAETENFNDYEVDAWTVPEGWTQDGTLEDFDLQIVEEDSNKFLQVETPKDGYLAKTINPEQTGYNVWVDAKVKFTPFDQAPAIGSDAKIAVWYLAQDAEGEPDTEGYKAGQTNLMVTAGVLDADGNVAQKLVALDVAEFDPNEWHQLKIESKGSIVTPEGLEGGIPNRLGFTITLDNNEVAATETFLTSGEAYLTADAKALGKKLFPSLGTDLVVSALALQGSGSIDDITIDAIKGEIDIQLPTSDFWEASALSKTSGNPGDKVTMTLTITDEAYLFKDGTSVKEGVAATVDANGIAQIDDTEAIETLPILVNVVAGDFEADYVDLAAALAKVAELTKADPDTEVDIEAKADCEAAGYSFSEGAFVMIFGSEWEIEADAVSFLVGLENRKIVNAQKVASFTFGGLMKPGAQLTAGEITTDETYPILLAINEEEGGATITTTTDNLAVGAADSENYEIEKIDNGDETFTYQLKKKQVETYVAEVGGKQYTTLAEAYEATEAGQTITLLANCAGNGISIKKSITIDFNDFTYTVNFDPAGSTGTKSQAFQILQEAGAVTFKNGTITSTDVVKMLVNNYADLTLDGMTLDGTQMGVAHKAGTETVVPNYTLSNNNGTTTLTGDTEIISKGEGHFAMDTYDAPKYDGVPTVVVNGATIKGDVELTGGNLTLTAGTLEGALVATAIGNGVITKADGFTAAAPEGYEWDKEGKLVEESEEPQIVPEEQGTVEFKDDVAVVTPKEGVTEITVNPPIGFTGKYEIPVSITKITGVEISQLIIKSGEYDIAPACKLVEGVIELNEAATVKVDEEQIPVKPTLTEATDEVKPLAVGETTEVGVKAIPGLTYSLVRSETIGGEQKPVATEKAKSARVTLTDEFVGGKPASAFYVIQVTK